MQKAKPVTDVGLPKLVGYKELEEAFGLTRRQLERMQRDGRFPRAIDITGAGGNRRAWPLQQVLDWFEQRRACVTRLAVSQPDKLKPEQVENAAYELAARHISNQLGQPIEGEKVVLGFVQERATEETADDFFTGWTGIWAWVERCFSRLDEAQSNAVAFGLFPALRARAPQLSAKAAQLGLKPVELAMLTLAGPEGSKALLQWRDRKQGGRT
jgi:predicted DNA-binding transcriptional regulator AlpA